MPLDMKDKILPPSNQEAEQGLLGVLLNDNRAYETISSVIRSEHFHYPVHARIFEEIKTKIDENKNASPVSLKNCFGDDPDLKDAGGAEYLAELAGSIISSVNALDYALNLKELYTRRKLIEAANTIITKANNYSLSNRGDALAEAEALITKLSDHSESKSFTAAQAVEKAFVWMQDIRNGKIVPLQTGFPRLDEKISGLYPGRLYIVAARPGMGKTALGLNIADNVAQNHPALFVSLEMTAQEIGARLAATRTGIAINRQQSMAKLGHDEWISMSDAQASAQKINLTIEDSSGIDIHGIKSIARRHKRRHGKYVLVIDYLGLISADREIKNKVHQIEEITTNLKRLSKELEIPIVLLCQLSRAVEGRDDKRPTLSDLRDSGSIEQDADVVMFIYREEYYATKHPPPQGVKEPGDRYNSRVLDWHQRQEDAKGKADIIIAKNRQGVCGAVTINFNGQRQRFFE